MLLKVDEDLKKFFIDDFMISGDNIYYNKKGNEKIVEYIMMCTVFIYTKLDKKDREKYFKIIADFIENNVNNLIYLNIDISFQKDYIISTETSDKVFNNLLYVFFEIVKRNKRFRKYLYQMLMVS